METCLLKYFIFNEDLRSTCDFNQDLLLEGPGIYEVLKVLEGKPIFLLEHLNRFFISAKHEGFNTGLKDFDILFRIKTLIDQNRMINGNIRFQYLLHPDLGNIFLVWAISYHYPTYYELNNGVKIESIKAVRENPQSKRTNLPIRDLAEKIIKKQQIAEILLVNEDGFITEGSRSNIFFIKQNRLYTPHADLVLQGITRDKIIELANSNHIEVIEENIHLDSISDYEACFLSSTSKNILPVQQIDGINFLVKEECLEDLIKLFNELLAKSLADFSWNV